MPLETKPSNIRLDRAVLCMNCEHITDSTKNCFNCGSIAVYSVAKFLNHKQIPMSTSSYFIEQVDRVVSASKNH